MSREDLQNKHLSDLHELAAKADVPKFRLLTRDELIDKIAAAGPTSENGGSAGREDDDEARSGDRPKRRRRRRRGGRGSSEDSEGAQGSGDPEGSEPREDKADDSPGSTSTTSEEDDPKDDERSADTEDKTGVLDLLSQGHGFLRLSGLEPGEGDVYVSASQIKRCELRAGDEVAGPVRSPRRGERHPALVRVETVNGAEASESREASFEGLTPIAPHRRIPMKVDRGDVLVRATEVLTPLAYGQRVLVRAQPRSGRTTLLRGLVKAIAAADDAPGIVVLLVDERPEEITAWRREAPEAEIAAAGADLEAPDQVRHAELALARAKRRAERGEDIVFIVDSLTRLGVAHRDPGSVKPLFGAGRETEEEGSGSLTVIATVLSGTEDGNAVAEAVETTENATIALDQTLAAAGITPALDVARCAVSGEESLRDESELAAVRRLRADLGTHDAGAGAASLRERIDASASNEELLSSL